jgi:hypothetical protein
MNAGIGEENQAEVALTPIEERQIVFYEDKLTAALVETEDGQSQIYIPLRPLCEYLGLSWSSQLQRTKRDPVLNEALNSVFITNTELSGVGKGQRKVVCLMIEQLPGWLFGISASRVRPELEEKIIRYRFSSGCTDLHDRRAESTPADDCFR